MIFLKCFLILLFLAIIIGAGIIDWKYREVSDYVCITCYILALILALMNRMSFKAIILNSVWLSGTMLIISYISIKVKEIYSNYKIQNSKIIENKIADPKIEEEFLVGGGDIKIAPAITLFTCYNGIIPIYIAFLLALIDDIVFKRTKTNTTTPFVTYLAIGCVFSIIMSSVRMCC